MTFSAAAVKIFVEGVIRMPKTRNVFALRDFDRKNILKRKWFWNESDFYPEMLGDLLGDLPIELFRKNFVDDDEIIWHFKLKVEKGIDDDDFETASKSLVALQTISRALCEYGLHLYRHAERLRCYVESINRVFVYDESVPVEIIRLRIRRANQLVGEYNRAGIVAQDKGAAIRLELSDIEATFNSRVRNEFATTLRKARREKKMSQAEFSAKIFLPPTTYAQYEQAKSEPSIATLYKICRTLDISADKLIGLT